jgi:hypothetical protein
MNLRARLESRTTILSDLAMAAEERYWEGLELGTHGHFSAAIYHLGFAAEMWLKYACLRFDGLTPADIWDVGTFVLARAFLRGAGQTVDHEAWHSLRFFAGYLRVRRAHRGRPLNSDLEAALRHRSNRLYGTGWVSMRYFPTLADEYDMRRAYDDASWFRLNVERLWR